MGARDKSQVFSGGLLRSVTQSGRYQSGINLSDLKSNSMIKEKIRLNNPPRSDLSHRQSVDIVSSYH